MRLIAHSLSVVQDTIIRPPSLPTDFPENSVVFNTARRLQLAVYRPNHQVKSP